MWIRLYILGQQDVYKAWANRPTRMLHFHHPTTCCQLSKSHNSTRKNGTRKWLPSITFQSCNIYSSSSVCCCSCCKLHRMNTAKRAAQLLSTQNIRSLFDSVEAFLFDCDGVIWKGDKLIDGVSQTLDWLRSKGKKLVFVTNNSLKSRIQYAKKFHSLGISVAEDEIFSSSFAAAMYLKVNNFPQEKKVYVIGGEGILEELQLAGYKGLGGPEDGEKQVELKPNSLFEHDKSVGAVVVGIDPRINYYKLQYGTLCIRENPGCLFIATNRDAVGHMTDLQEWPGAGSMVAAMCGSTEREPIVVGKPSTFMMDFLLQKFHINTSNMCMVGDRLNTDILFGQNAGCKTLLVLSGVTTQTTLQDPSNRVQPDYYTSQVSDLLHLLGP
ncbi:hypothetical protein H0E87_027555 [Populus deltoides]|uniref:phosphoglycolate phosphatase n=1 Tax=Populus deltoides TaxID=3696 RepID=A0A8T2X158_POPDE|nr:hypothetical protein H0E87_027555 [Populus deltoides]